MPTYKILTAEQDAIVQAVIDKVRGLPTMPPTGEDNEADYPASDVYIVRTPETGIPTYSPLPGTGSGTTTDPMHGDEPGSATCDVYRIDGDDVIQAVEHTVTVWNLSAAKVRGGIFIAARKDKFGSWIADPPQYPALRGKTMVDVAPGAAADFYVYEGTFGAETATGVIIASVYNATSCTIKSNMIATAEYVPDNDGWQFRIYKTV